MLKWCASRVCCVILRNDTGGSYLENRGIVWAGAEKSEEGCRWVGGILFQTLPKRKGLESCLILVSRFRLWQEETNIRDKNEKCEKKIKVLRKARHKVQWPAPWKEARRLNRGLTGTGGEGLWAEKAEGLLHHSSPRSVWAAWCPLGMSRCDIQSIPWELEKSIRHLSCNTKAQTLPDSGWCLKTQAM